MEGTEIPAHRLILSASSPVFEAMFSHKMSESIDGVVDIDDIPLESFQLLLEYSCLLLASYLRLRSFIYQGWVDFEKPSPAAADSKAPVLPRIDQGQKLLGLLAAAHKYARACLMLLISPCRYQIPDLVTICTQRLASSATAEIASDCIALADVYQLPALKVRSARARCVCHCVHSCVRYRQRLSRRFGTESNRRRGAASLKRCHSKACKSGWLCWTLV